MRCGLMWRLRTWGSIFLTSSLWGTGWTMPRGIGIFLILGLLRRRCMGALRFRGWGWGGGVKVRDFAALWLGGAGWGVGVGFSGGWGGGRCWGGFRGVGVRGGGVGGRGFG